MQERDSIKHTRVNEIGMHHTTTYVRDVVSGFFFELR